MALIEIRLLDSNKQPLTNFRIGMPSHDEIPTEIQQIKFKRSEEEDLDQISSNHFLSVRIINTTLDAAALHGWIGKTMEQKMIVSNYCKQTNENHFNGLRADVEPGFDFLGNGAFLRKIQITFNCCCTQKCYKVWKDDTAIF